MPRGTPVVAKSHSGRRRLPYRRAIVGWLVGVLLLAGVGFLAIGTRGGPSPDGLRRNLLGELNTLRGDNDLFVLPETVADDGRSRGAGTLASTYLVAVLADMFDAAPQLLDDAVSAEVRRLIPQSRTAGGPTDLLMCAVVLRYAGSPDADLEAEAASLAGEWLSRGVGRDRIEQAAQVTTLLQQIGHAVPGFRADPFPVRSREDRYLAWRLMGIANFVTNAEELRSAFSPVIGEIRSVLASPDDLLVSEVSAALRVPGSGVDRNALPAELDEWADELRGCPGFSVLYRPMRAEQRCTLEATVQMFSGGLVRI